MPVKWLEPNSINFPPVEQALEEPNGLLAAGGNLTVPWLIEAYRHGIFPWFEDGQPILWWSPNPRMVLRPDDLRISRSLAKLLKRNPFRVSFDADFSSVIRACAASRPGSPGTWITQEMQSAYIDLFEAGIAHSVEVWDNDDLVGGLYGIAQGRVFFGESMFSKVSNASKIGFVHLLNQLKAWHFKLVDCQVSSEHLVSLGAIEISREDFQDYLSKYADNSDPDLDWRLEPSLQSNGPHSSG